MSECVVKKKKTKRSLKNDHVFCQLPKYHFYLISAPPHCFFYKQELHHHHHNNYYTSDADGHNSTSAETPSHITSSSAHRLEWCWRRWTEGEESLLQRQSHTSTDAASSQHFSEAAPPVTSQTCQTLHDSRFQSMDLDADCCHFGWRLCNFTVNHGLLQTAPPCDTLRTDTGFLAHRTVVHLLTDFRATAV